MGIPNSVGQKKDGSLRFCVDYRNLNKITKKDSYPLPRVDDLLDSLADAQWFSTLDLRSGYWQVEVDPADREKTASFPTMELALTLPRSVSLPTGLPLPISQSFEASLA